MAAAGDSSSWVENLADYVQPVVKGAADVGDQV